MPPEYVLARRSAGVGELEPLEHVPRPALGLVARQVVQAADHLQVLEPGEVLVDRGELPGQADLGPQPRRVPVDVQAGHPRGRPSQGGAAW